MFFKKAFSAFTDPLSVATTVDGWASPKLLYERWNFIRLSGLCEEFSAYFPKYPHRQQKWVDDAWMQILGLDMVNPFPPEKISDLHWEISFWVMRGLYDHYREQDPALAWKDFLSHTQGREEFKEGAIFVVISFPEIVRSDLPLGGQWEPARTPSSCDYAGQAALFRETVPALPLVIPTEILEKSVELLVSHLAVSLYVQKKARCPRVTWPLFFECLEADQLLKEILAQQVRWSYALNAWKLKLLWESKRVTIPPLCAGTIPMGASARRQV